MVGKYILKMNKILRMNEINNSINTYTGKTIDLLNPDPNQIDTIDIAKGLTNQARFCGQLHTYYSVADHSLLVADLAVDYARKNGLREEEIPVLQLYALLHDASEAYIKDIPRPLKVLLSDYLRIESYIMAAILEHFDITVSSLIKEIVKQADNEALEIEYDVFYQDGKDSRIVYRSLHNIYNFYYYRLERYIKEYKESKNV